MENFFHFVEIMSLDTRHILRLYTCTCIDQPSVCFKAKKGFPFSSIIILLRLNKNLFLSFTVLVIITVLPEFQLPFPCLIYYII